MGVGWRFKCNFCDFQVTTFGAWEFYRDEQNELKYYGHPIATIKGKKRGISGLAGTFFCLDCMQNVEVIIVEFKNPSFDAVEVWGGKVELKEKHKAHQHNICPDCGSQRIILHPPKDMKIECPRCKLGELKGEINVIT